MAKDSLHRNAPSLLNRRRFLTSAAVGLAATPLVAACSGTQSTPAAPASESGATVSRPKKDRYKMVFIQFLEHSVPAAWSKGIEDILKTQQNVDYQLLDGQAKADVQISLMDTAISQGVDVIFLQPVDSVGIGPSIKKAHAAGIPVLTLNIDSTESHAGHIEMNHYFGAIAIGQKMGEMIGGKGNVVILNAPAGIIIRDQRTNGFLAGLKKYPDIKVIADQPADWDRKKAQDIFSAILATNPNIQGVYGVNDSMALGAVDAAKMAGRLDQLIIFGNDGEKAALESIEKGELTGTQYTDVYQQGRFAASIGIMLATGGIAAQSIGNQAHILMPYSIITKENVGLIQPEQRW